MAENSSGEANPGGPGRDDALGDLPEGEGVQEAEITTEQIAAARAVLVARSAQAKYAYHDAVEEFGRREIASQVWSRSVESAAYVRRMRQEVNECRADLSMFWNVFGNDPDLKVRGDGRLDLDGD